MPAHSNNFIAPTYRFIDTMDKQPTCCEDDRKFGHHAQKVDIYSDDAYDLVLVYGPGKDDIISMGTPSAEVENEDSDFGLAWFRLEYGTFDLTFQPVVFDVDVLDANGTLMYVTSMRQDQFDSIPASDKSRYRKS